ncbi:MAG: hypothetical protein ACLFPJ_01585 [Candidatus Woesearchaeota archaeon]
MKQSNLKNKILSYNYIDDLIKNKNNTYSSDFLTCDIMVLPSKINCKKYFFPLKEAKNIIYNPLYDDLAARIIIESKKNNDWIGLSHKNLISKINDEIIHIKKSNKNKTKFKQFYDNLSKIIKSKYKQPLYSPIIEKITKDKINTNKLEQYFIEMNNQNIIDFKFSKKYSDYIIFPTKRLVNDIYFRQEF